MLFTYLAHVVRRLCLGPTLTLYSSTPTVGCICCIVFCVLLAKSEMQAIVRKYYASQLAEAGPNPHRANGISKRLTAELAHEQRLSCTLQQRKVNHGTAARASLARFQDHLQSKHQQLIAVGLFLLFPDCLSSVEGTTRQAEVHAAPDCSFSCACIDVMELTRFPC